jgi:hypothetical protein
MIIGIAVFTPCPISGLREPMKTRLSDSMRMKKPICPPAIC